MLRKCQRCLSVRWHEIWVEKIVNPFELHSFPYYRTLSRTRACLSISGKTSARPFATVNLTEPVQSEPSRKWKHAEQEIRGIQKKVNEILQSHAIPSETLIVSLLQRCEAYANLITKRSTAPINPSLPRKSPVDSLLDLESKEASGSSRSVDSVLGASNAEDRRQQVSQLAYDTMTDPKVFITPAILAAYVRTQSILGLPRTIPQVFVLYARKPIPRSKQQEIRYVDPNPNKVSAAIPLDVARLALDAAIKARDLFLCFDLINTSVGTTAFRRSKFVRRALFPLSALGLTPLAAYVAASKFADFQNTMDPATATNFTFAGITAYIGFTATLGIIAITTANDQMDRVTWAPGTPLRERWLREEERALIDKVAGAWGFQDKLKRGEEQGEDWEELREWIGLRGMMLDRVELMEGME